MADFVIATKNDVVTAGEDVSVNRALFFTKVDTLTAADFAGRNVIFTRNDTATVADAKQVQQGKILAESLTAFDNALLEATHAFTKTDTVTAADAKTREVMEVVDKADTVTANDTAQLEATHHFLKNDALYAEDSWGLNDASFFRPDDTATVADTTQREAVWHRLRDDVVTANDNAVLEATHEFTKTDTVTAADDYTRGLFVRQKDDTTAPTDAKAVIVGHEVTKADAVTAQDAVSKRQGKEFADTVTALDAREYVENEVLSTAHDTVTVVDAKTVIRSIYIDVVDTVDAEDTTAAFSAPRIELVQPLDHASGVPATSPLILDVHDGLGTAIAIDSIRITVTIAEESTLVVDRYRTILAGWAGRVFGYEDAARFELYPPSGFPYGAHVEVTVTFDDGPSIGPAQGTVTDPVSAEDAFLMTV